MSLSTTRAGTAYKRYMEMESGSESFTDDILETGGVGVDGQRSGVEEVFRPEQAVGEEAAGSVAAVMQMLMEERRQRQAEQAEERRKWELEMKARDEESARREEYNRRQMEILQSLVQGVQMQGEAVSKRVDGDKDVKVPKLTEEDDIVAYLTTFERLMTAYEVKRERWVFKLASNLTGKAQQAYAGLSTEDASNYEKLKEAILQRYDITEESYRQRFRLVKKKSGESCRELTARLDDLASKWLKSCKSAEEVRDKIVLEHFLSMQPEEICIFVRERKPSTSEEAGRLADDFLQARKESSMEKEKSQNLRRENNSERDRRSQDLRRSDRTVKNCLKCGIPGHLAKDCRVKLEKSEDHRERSRHAQKKDLKDIECFNCRKKGHYSSNCPHRAMFCTERKVRAGRQEEVKRRPAQTKPGVVKSGRVEGRAVDNILLDAGCSRTLVHRKFVSEGKLQAGEAVAIRCAHGDTVLYPLAKISLEVEGRPIEVEAAISDTLPMSVLLGVNIPELTELLQGEEQKETEEAYAVVTRAEAKKKKAEEEESRRQEACGVQPKGMDALPSGSDTTPVVEEESESWINSFDESLFSGGRQRRKKTRREKRMEKQRRSQLQVEVEEKKEDMYTGKEARKHELDMSAEELKLSQALDPTLEDIRSAVKTRESTEGVGFFYKDDLLYRRWIPSRVDRGATSRSEKMSMAVEQLVLPKKCRRKVMEMAHSIPLAGLWERRQLIEFYRDFIGPVCIEILQISVAPVTHARRHSYEEQVVHH